MNDRQLIEAALEARKKAYAPYSNFSVGAAIVTKSGHIYTGCNIENSSYGATNCAERTAIFKAVSEGERNFEAIAICGGMKDDDIPKGYAYPCGICRQVMREFCDPDSFRVIFCKSESEFEVHILKEILPFDFGPENLY